ncbi:hypothetical protein LSCM4_05812 [Leishmania orientalis]|uniref:Uncharacterized protein n=1 Tax=Leishmania orientalis TaxID=2249476 RepID=A0A836GTF9_9TRYP|nr:hypothetical protein LSCM4_05812 [Leishmania orientalis]
MGSSSSRGRGTSLSHPAVDGGSRHQRNRDLQARERRSLKRLSSTKHASAVASSVGAGTASAYRGAPSSSAANASSTRRQHRDAAAGAVTVSSVMQGSRLASPVSPTRQPERHSLSSLSTLRVKPSPARAAVVASTGFHHAFSGVVHSVSSLGEREGPYAAELSQRQQNTDLNLVAISVPHSCRVHGDGDNADSGGSQSGSVMCARRTRSSSILQAATDTAVPLPFRALLGQEDAYFAANDAGATSSLTGGHIRETVSGTCCDDTEVDVGEHNTASSSSQVGRAGSTATSIPKGGMQTGPPSLSCSPLPAASPLPVPFGRAACFTNVPQSPSAAISTATPQCSEERLDDAIKAVVKRGSSEDKAGRKSKAEGTSDGCSSSSGGGGFWRGQSRNMFRKLLSRGGSYAESSPSPSRPEGGKGGGSARGSQVTLEAEKDSDSSGGFAPTVAKKRASPAPRADDLLPSAPPSTASAAQGTEQKSSTELPPFPAGASTTAAATELPAPTPPISSMMAPRASMSQPPHAGVSPGGSAAVVLAEREARSPAGEPTSPHAADRVSKPRPSGTECAEALHCDMRGSKGAPDFLSLAPEAQAARQDSEESDSTTSTDTNSAPILPPPPAASFAEAVWGAQGATAPASQMAATKNTSLFSHDDCVAAAAASPSPIYGSEPRRRLKAPGVLSTTTVTDTTARVSPRSPFASPLTAVAAAAFPFSFAAGARVKGRRSVSQSVIIAAWNRMGARSGAIASGASAGVGHHGGGGNPEAPAETLQIVPAPAKSLAVLDGGNGGGGDDLTASAAPASRDAQIPCVTTALAAEAATGEAPSPSHQRTDADDWEAGSRGRSHRSRASAAVVLPVRRRSVVTCRRGPPPVFPPSPHHSKLSDTTSTDAPDETTADHAATAPQELQRRPALPAEKEAEERFLVRVPPPRRELAANLQPPTAASSAIVTQWSSPPESQESDVGVSAGQPLQERILVLADFEVSSRGGLAGERARLPVYDAAAEDGEMASATATTVDADEDDRGNEAGAPLRRATQRSPQSLAGHQHRRQSIEAPPRRAFTPAFTTTHTSVPAANAATDVLSATNHDRQYSSQPRLGVSSCALTPNTSAGSPFGAIAWVQSSFSSPRSYSASESRPENAEEEGDSIDEAGLRRARDREAAHAPLHRPEDECAQPLAGLDVIAVDQHFSSPPAHGSQRDSSGFNAMTATNLSGGGSHGATLVRSNSYQLPRQHSQRALVSSTSSLPSTARLMPRWQERLTPTPQPTSPLSSSAARDDAGGAAGWLLSTPRGRRVLASQGTPPLAHQPSAHPHQPLPSLMPTPTSHMPQHLRRETPNNLGSTRWQEVSLRASGGQLSPNFDFAESSRDNVDTPPRYDVLGDEDGYLGATVNAYDAEGGGDDGARRRDGCPLSGAVGDDAGDDGDETFLCWESSGAPTWGIATWQTWQRGDEDEEEGYEEEEEKGDVSENDAGSCSNADCHSVDRRRLPLPQHRHRCQAVLPPTVAAQLATQQQKPQGWDHLGSTSRGLDHSAPSAAGISHSSIRTRAFAYTIGCFSRMRYEPPMLSNRNTFTAFVPLSDISSAQLLDTAAAAFQCGIGAHLRSASPGVHNSEAAAATSGDDCDSGSQAGLRVDTPATADTLILNGYTLQDACLAEGADVRADIVNIASGELPISPLCSSVSTAPTNHISRFNTPVPLAVDSAVCRRASRSEEAETPHVSCESPDALSGSAPPKSRGVTKAPPGRSHTSAAAAVEPDGNGGGNGGSDDLPAPAAHPAATSRRTSWSLESARVTAAPVSEGERHALLDEERSGLDAFMHSPASLHSAAAVRATLDGPLPQSAQLSASLSLSGQYSPPQPWWNRHRCITQSEGSGTLDLSQRGGESGNGGGDNSPFSPRSAHCAPTVVPGGHTASLASSAGSMAIDESPPDHTLPPGGSAVAPLALRRSSGRLRYETQCPKALTNYHCGSALRCSHNSASNEGANAARRGVAGATSRGGPNGEVTVNQVRHYDVDGANEEGAAEIKDSAAPAAKHASHDRHDDHVGPASACVSACTWQPWMPIVSPSSQSVAATASAEMACAEAEGDGELAVTAPDHAMTTATVVLPTASFMEEADGQLEGDASPDALAVVAASREPCDDAKETTPEKKALDGGGDGTERSEVGAPVLMSHGVRMHRSGVNSTSVTQARTALASALGSLQETEAYARTCIEESLADVREAWVTVWRALQMQHEQLLLQQQSVPTTAPSGLPSARFGIGLVEGSASVAIGSAAGVAGSGGGGTAAVSTSTSLGQLTSTKSVTAMACPEKVVPPLLVVLVGGAASTTAATTEAAGGAGPHSVSGSDAACGAGADRGDAATPTAATTMTSRKSCGSLVSPSPSSELLLMPRHGGDGGEGSGRSSALFDERVIGVMMDSSTFGAEAASAVSCGDIPSISAAVATAGVCSGAKVTRPTLVLFGPRNACTAPITGTGLAAALPPAAPCLSEVVAGPSEASEAHGVARGKDHDVHIGADAGVEGQHDPPHPPLTADPKDAHSVGAPLTTSHCIADSSSVGLAVRMEQLDSSLDDQTPLTLQQSSPEPAQPITFGAVRTPVSPTCASVRSLLRLKEETALDTRAASRGQARSSDAYGQIVSPLLHDDNSTPPARARSRPQRQHRGPSVGQVVCRWCDEPYTSTDVCLVARRLHSVLREERRIEKAAKRTAQMLLCEGRVREAVTLLKSAGVCVL